MKPIARPIFFVSSILALVTITSYFSFRYGADHGARQMIKAFQTSSLQYNLEQLRLLRSGEYQKVQERLEVGISTKVHNIAFADTLFSARHAAAERDGRLPSVESTSLSVLQDAASYASEFRDFHPTNEAARILRDATSTDR